MRRKPNAIEFTLNEQAFAEGANNLDIKYGLPQNVEFCARCCVSNQRSNSTVEPIEKTDASAAATAQALYWKRLSIADLRRVLKEKQCYVRKLLETA